MSTLSGGDGKGLGKARFPGILVVLGSSGSNFLGQGVVMNRPITLHHLLLIVVACFWGGTGCSFDKGGISGGPRDAAQNNNAHRDAAATDASRVDAQPQQDAAPQTDAGDPCLAADPPWWNPAWHRRRGIDLGTVMQDYTVALELTGSLRTEIENHARGDYEDLRILRYFATWEELDRTIRDDAGVTLIIRFKVQEDLDGSPGEPQYFLYYDNPQAGAAPRDPNGVFLFFDSFNRSSLGIGGTYHQWDINSTSRGDWRIVNNELVQDGTGLLTALVVTSLAGLLEPGFLVSYRWLSDATCPDSGPAFHWIMATNDGYYVEREPANAALFSEPTHTLVDTQPIGAAADAQWHRHVLRVHNGTVTFFEDQNSVQFSLPHTYAGSETVGVATFCPRSGPFRFDDLMVRYYLAPEPVLTLDNELHCP